VTVLHVNFWFGHFSRGVVSICYITLAGCVREMLYCVTYRVGQKTGTTDS